MSELKSVYDSGFYSAQVQGSVRSANAVIPLLLKLLPETKSVLDVGCGTGAWLSIFERLGVTDIFGIDGGGAEGRLLFIEPELFQSADLELPIQLPRRFDLCMCLELAEHLTRERAASFVKDLCQASDVVMFSAAIPGQGGTQHLNEAWLSSWAMLFSENGYKCFDLIRPQLWSDDRVDWWYRQNLVLFANKRREDITSKLDCVQLQHGFLDIVHPLCFKQFRDRCEQLEHEISTLWHRIAEVERNASQLQASNSTGGLLSRLKRALK